jgi:serine/threonine-protein kinase RsbW
MLTPPDNVDTVHELLETVWENVPEIDMVDRFSFETALIELASNVMRHADPGSGVMCTLTVETFPDRIQATRSDSGMPGDIQLTERSMPDEFAESGRGIPLIIALVDELRYDREDGYNHWFISRHLQA